MSSEQIQVDAPALTSRTPAGVPASIPAPPASLSLTPAQPYRRVPLTPRQLRFQTRMWCLFILWISGAIVGLGLIMTPSPKGIGTHVDNFSRFGLMPCGMYATTGVPCPTCGCTNAVTWFVHGHPLKDAITQPFGALFGLVAVVMLVLSLVGLVTGRWYGPQPFTVAWYWRGLLLFGLTTLVGGWMYKIVAVRWGI
jgi:hypothetical protein